MKNKVPVIIALVGVIATMVLITGVLKSSKKPKNTGISITSEAEAQKTLNNIMKDVTVKEASKIKSTVDYSDNTVANLPNIETKYPLTVTGQGDVNIEIFSTSEKAGKNNNGWLNEIAEEFNKSRPTLDNGRVVSVSVRSIPSGASCDYIANNVYIPQAYTPSNELFGELAVRSEEHTSELQSPS